MIINRINRLIQGTNQYDLLDQAPPDQDAGNAEASKLDLSEAGTTAMQAPAPTFSSAAVSGRAGLLAGAAADFAGAAAGANGLIRLGDVVVNSAEHGQNSEPSLGVNPLDPNQVVVGSFSSAFVGNAVTTPYFKSTDGGLTWSDYGSLTTQDKSITWKADGSAVLTTTLLHNVIDVHSGTTGGSNFGGAIGSFSNTDVDQPWIRTGPSNHVYISFNDLTNFPNGKTASVLVSTNGGTSFTDVLVDKVGAGANSQDAPSVRLAVNGSTVYSAFTRWDSLLDTDAGSGDSRYNSHVVIVRSDNGGADNFGALGAGGNGVTVATPTSGFSGNSNSPLSLGQERTGGDLAIAVDPNNANHVVLAYGDAPGAVASGNLRLHVAESYDGGLMWTEKFISSSTVRAALPALAINNGGAVGLLYATYDPGADKISDHFLTTTNDFVNVNDTVLSVQSNATPA